MSLHLYMESCLYEVVKVVRHWHCWVCLVGGVWLICWMCLVCPWTHCWPARTDFLGVLSIWYSWLFNVHWSLLSGVVRLLYLYYLICIMHYSLYKYIRMLIRLCESVLWLIFFFRRCYCRSVWCGVFDFISSLLHNADRSGQEVCWVTFEGNRF